MSTNRSVWQDKAGVPGAIREIPVPSKVADGELVVKVYAWAVNPADTMVQDMALPFITYPLILGEDVAGTVKVVGSAAASKFKAGDCILAMALCAAVMNPEQGGFPDYVILDHTMACKIPESLSLNDASVFPLWRRSWSIFKGLPRHVFPQRQLHQHWQVRLHLGRQLRCR
jgi:NADPH:quinone reductase-like Zn-dependent oxidoreductase